MLRIDLTALGQSDLRRLLAAAEGRGQGALADDLRAELAARAAGERSASPAPPSFDADDDTLPMAVTDAASDLWLPPDATRRAARRPFALPVVLALLVAGGATAWAVNGAPGLERSEPTPGPAAPAVMVAAPAPAPPAPRAMVARADPIPAPPPPAEMTAPRSVHVERPAPRRLDPCAAPPTPADRALCGDLGLNLLEHEMREAYGQAMMSGVDTAALRDSQAAWRRMRDPTSDHRALAQLYDRRIRDLKAMQAPDAAPPTQRILADRQEN